MSSSLEGQGVPADDPLRLLRRIACKLNTEWLRTTYPFAAVGRRLSIAPSCDIKRGSARQITLGDDIVIAQDTWLNVAGDWETTQVKIVLGSGCKIGRRSTLSAKRYIELESDVLLAPGVLIMDHNHEYSDPDAPIHAQGETTGARIVIGRNCWLGHGSVVCCSKGELRLGRNCVVGANSVVTRSFPDYSVIAGNPAKVVKTYDRAVGEWVRVAHDF